jgi:hypothetical protein
MRDGVVLKSPLLPFTERTHLLLDGTYDSTVIVIHPIIQHVTGNDKSSSIITAFDEDSQALHYMSLSSVSAREGS